MSTTINIITDDDVVAGFESMEDGGSGSASTGECDAVLSILDGGKTVLQGLASGISTPGVVELAVGLCDVLLGIGGGHVDGGVDAAMDGLGLLSGVDGEGGETGVSEGQVGRFREGFKGYLWLVLLVEHINSLIDI